MSCGSDIDQRIRKGFRSGIKDFGKIYEGFKQIYKGENDNNIFSLLNESVLRLYLAKGLSLIDNFKGLNAEKSYPKNKRKKLDLQIITKDDNLLNFELKIEKGSNRVGCAIRDTIYDAIRLNREFNNQNHHNYVVIMIYPKFILKNSSNNSRKTTWPKEFFELLESTFLKDKNDLDIKNFAKNIKEIIKNKNTQDTKWNEWFNSCENSNISLKLLDSFCVNDQDEIVVSIYKVYSSS